MAQKCRFSQAFRWQAKSIAEGGECYQNERLFEPFMYINEHFTKTGSGRT